ncbi:MAG TPA: RNA ligase family protein [Saccharofermentans sp.]|nr:RNA ligase family protein [Saccharofermentans sp.]
MNFLKYYILNEAEVDTKTKREAMKKIHQMNDKEFIQFFKELLPYIKNGAIDLDLLRITEKIDGSSFRFAVYQGEIFGETSNSGMQKADKFSGPMKNYGEVLRYIESKFGKKLLELHKKYGDFKVYGELFYLDGLPIDKDGTVTFVATKYDAKKLGTFATFVIFDILLLENGKFEKVPGHPLNKEIRALSNKEFTVLENNVDFRWNGSIPLFYEVDDKTMKKVVTNVDALDHEELESLRDKVNEAFVKYANEKGSLFGVKDSKVEGLVLHTIGGLVGIQNPEWKYVKEEYFKISGMLEERQKKFMADVTGYKARKFALKYVMDNKTEDKLLKTFAKHLDQYQKDINKIIDQWEQQKANVPSPLKDNQSAFIAAEAAKLNNMDKDKINTLIAYFGGDRK